MSLSKEQKRKMYKSLVLVRKFEEKMRECFLANKIPGFVHPYLGEEAVAVGVCSALIEGDKVFTHHRGTGHALALGCDPNRVMAEIFGKKDGLNGGRVGQMHLTDVAKGLVASNGIVGGAAPLSVGGAFACKHKKQGNLAIAFCGDGGSNRGTVHEALVVASVKKLPLIMVVENNLIQGANRFADMCNTETIACRAAGYGIPGVTVDGNDPEAVYEAVCQAAEHARSGEGPSIIECLTWRMDGHYIGDTGFGKLPGENEEWQKKDPIKLYSEKLIAGKVATQAELDAMDAEAAEVVEAAEAFADNSPFPDKSVITNNVYAC